MLESVPGVLASVLGAVFLAALALIVGLVTAARARAVHAEMASVRVVTRERAAQRTSGEEEP